MNHGLSQIHTTHMKILCNNLIKKIFEGIKWS